MKHSSKFLISFLESMKNRMGLDDPKRNASDRYERGQQIVPDSIKPNEGEVPVKQYVIAVLRNLLRFERAEGRLQVTNKRVIFRAAGTSLRGRTTLHQEYAIDEIAGIEARNNYKFNFLYFIFSLLILYGAYFIIFKYGPSERMMHPSHVIEAREKQAQAIDYTQYAAMLVREAESQLRPAEEEIKRAERDITEGILRTRRVPTGSDWYGNAVYRTESYRDTSEAAMDEAEQNLVMAMEEKKRVEGEIEQAKSNLAAAKRAEEEAIKHRITTERIWAVLMTMFGILLGIGGIIPFFYMYKKFGRKLFILCFSNFGFQLSLVASGSGIFYLFMGISALITIFCMFLYCFRPNLVISILNKVGSPAAIDVRRELPFMMIMEKGIGFTEVIPTEESESAIREICAIISDIQKLGDFGMNKWIEK